jgi:hypothetical protein
MTTPMPAAPQGQPATPDNGMGTAALVMGILQFVCLGFVGSILAIIFGRIGMKKADQGLATNRSSAQWGFWLGIVGLILFVIGIIIWIVVFAFAASTGNLEMTTS